MNNFWKNKKILITGINGFVGGNLANELVKNKAKVFGLIRGYDQASFLYHENIDKKCKLMIGELTNKDLIKSIVVENKIQIVFHLAAQVEVGVALDNPYDTFETNIRGTYSLLQVLANNKKYLKSIIIASSDKAYGEYSESELPYKENYDLRPKYPYDISKACADLISQFFSKNPYNLPIIITRFANIYGPGQINFSALIPDAIKSALGYKKFIARSNGKHKRDYLYIEDVVGLYLLISKNLYLNKDNYSGEIFNAGTNNFYNVKYIVKYIFKKLNKENKLKIILKNMENKKPKGEIVVQSMDYQKVFKKFKWKPKTSFNDGIKKTISWYEKYLKDIS
tara:strand:+ start:136 stop:1149 length:1014 start_codon:yes stop_codon:yes gene_type:complete